jgi:GNAT superfamily N-acetyltransferase
MRRPGASGSGELVVARASSADWSTVDQWAADEGWNPGRHDAACFLPTDTDGFFLGRRSGRPVSAVSVVNYSDRYAFLGYYLVHPDLRGHGLGLATWRAALPHAGSRTIGLDAVPAQEATYRRSGFVAHHTAVRYAGRPARSDSSGGSGHAGDGVRALTAEHLDAVAAYDLRCFPAPRRDFLARWLSAPGHLAYGRLREGSLTGYGVIRPARSGYRIGPLFADSAADAEALLDALVARLGPDDEVYADVPESHPTAGRMAESRGLAVEWYTVRMYRGPVPEASAARVFCATSLELG